MYCILISWKLASPMISLARQSTKKQAFIYFVLLTLTMYQLVRVIVFVNVYGGLEHDGGWLLSISRSLAERGTYTTMVSTIVEPNVRGGVNVDGKFDIQDEEGRIWFFTGNGIGPASIVVNAIFLKLLGVGFWQFHLGPLFFFALYLVLASGILLAARGVSSMLLFHLYLYLYPHLSIFLGYEAMGEVPSMAYILLAYVVCAHTVQQVSLDQAIGSRKRRLLWFFLSGLAAGLAINAKLIALLSLGGIFALWLGLLWQRRTTLLEGLVLAGGTLTIPVLWELIQLVGLIYLANFEMYGQHLQGRIGFILGDGSGLGAQAYGDLQFYWDKALIISEISRPDNIVSLLTLLLVAIGGPVLIWLYRPNRARQNWVILLWLGWLGNAAWFIGLSETGWVRHAWVELILAVMILCLIFGELLHRLKQRPNWRNAAAATLAGGLLVAGFAAQTEAVPFFITEQLVESWRQKQVAAKYTKVPWIITSRAEQQRVVDFLQQLPAKGRVFYPANHKAAEIAVQTGKIFYPIERRNFMPPAEGDVILVGATLISPWKDPGIRHSIIERAKVECPNFLYQSEYYIICSQQ